MNLLKILLTIDTVQPSSPTSLTLSDLNLHTNIPLPENYYHSLIGHHSQENKRAEIYKDVVLKFNRAASLPEIIKSLTILLTGAIQSRFSDDFLQQLQKIQTPSFNSPDIGAQWVRDLTTNVKSYLLRLPSIAQVFRRALQQPHKRQSLSTMLADLYLIINTFGVLFPSTVNAFNTIGRYYIKANPFYTQFYKMLRQHFLLGYNYMRLIVNALIKSFEVCKVKELQCFIDTLPEIQLMCDKMQDLLMNKYFKGKPPGSKLYFKEEEIQEITYHLKRRSGKDVDDTETAEDELFGEFQF